MCTISGNDNDNDNDSDPKLDDFSMTQALENYASFFDTAYGDYSSGRLSQSTLKRKSKEVHVDTSKRRNGPNWKKPGKEPGKI